MAFFQLAALEEVLVDREYLRQNLWRESERGWRKKLEDM